MYRSTIHVGATSDPEDVVRSTVLDAERHGMSPEGIEQMRGELLAVVEPLAARAADFERIGSRLVVERRVEGEGYRINVECRVGDRPSAVKGWISRLMSR